MEPRDKEPRIWAPRDRTVPPSPKQAFAKQLRAAPTEAEHKLWWHLRYRLNVPGTHFRRQVRVGPYIADFATHKTKLIIEVDGGQHAIRTAADEERTRVLEANGYRVLRFWNNDVLQNIDGVLEEIQRTITTTPTPDPSPQGGGGRRDR